MMGGVGCQRPRAFDPVLDSPAADHRQDSLRELEPRRNGLREIGLGRNPTRAQILVNRVRERRVRQDGRQVVVELRNADELERAQTLLTDADPRRAELQVLVDEAARMERTAGDFYEAAAKRTGDPGQDYYADGLQDILITELFPFGRRALAGRRVTEDLRW